MTKSQQRGVTLVELMTVVMVLAILASIAIPSYRKYMIRSQRTDATAALLRIQTAQEKFFLQNNRYSDDLTAAPPDGLGLIATSDGGFYDLDLDTPSDVTYTVTATPRGHQSDDTKCAQMTINQTGTRGALDSGDNDVTAECWK